MAFFFPCWPSVGGLGLSVTPGKEDESFFSWFLWRQRAGCQMTANVVRHTQKFS